MASVNRRWLPLALIAVAAAASVASYERVPAMLTLPVGDLLPFGTTPPPGPAPRLPALFLLPALALVLWCAFRWAPTASGQRAGRRLFRHAPEAVTSPAQFERFGKTYDAIVLGVVLLLLGVHAAVLAAALGHSALASRMVPAVLGGCLVLMGNVMPRLRPNWVAGLRTTRTLGDPQLWRNTHRLFGAALVISGVLTCIVAALAPRYGVLAFIGSLLVSLLVGLAASLRKSGETLHAAGG
jgi:hypothetical protein